MLSLCLHARDAGGAWAPAPGGWSAGRSAILPYDHPALDSCMLVSPRRTAVLVRERIGGEPQPRGARDVAHCGERRLDHELAAVRRWPLDFLELLIERSEGAAEVRLRAGGWGTAPVYLLARGGTLRVDWDVARLYPHLRSSRLEPVFAAQYLLALGHPYSRRTVFPGVWMLTERATASWRPPYREIEVTYPPPQRRSRPTRLGRNPRVEATFREILAASMRRWLPSPDDVVAVELSGGLDSSIVAATAARIASGAVHSYGMIMPGSPGGHQRVRRREVVRRFGLRDRARPCTEDPPFSRASRRVRDLAIVPWGELYEEAVGTMLERAAADGARLIFTGLGGDELCSYQPGEVEEEDEPDAEPEDGGPEAGHAAYPPFVTSIVREAYEGFFALSDEAPQALVETSALESAAAVATLHLRRGVWPASPLCTPELVEFCRRLPLAWRDQRMVERRVLRSLGCSRTVTHARPEHLETFNDVMEFALRRASASVITRLFRDSRLAGQGLVDRDRLLAAYARYRRGDLRYGDRILGAVVLELTVRSVEKGLASRPAAGLSSRARPRAAAAR
jgi:asparagine synthase (glutamine-hydrolysing)